MTHTNKITCYAIYILLFGNITVASRTCMYESMCNDIQQVRVNYKLIDQCYDIDRQVREIYDWYDYRKELLKQYECERKIALEKLKALDAKSKVLNNTIQNIKSQASFRDRHAVSYSQLHDNLHL